MRNVCVNIFSASDADSSNGSKIDANQLVSASFAVRISDTDLDGTIKIQASNDQITSGTPRANFTPTNWVDIPDASVTVTNGVPSASLIVIPNMCFSWVRAVLTQTTPGTGTANVDMNALGV
jgi:hypothetical protein